jgi:hypothetical protein
MIMTEQEPKEIEHTQECVDYNDSFYGDKANLGECICPDEPLEDDTA